MVVASYVVARTAEIPPGGRKIVEVAKRSIGIFNVGGKYYALRNVCIHNQAPVCLGEVGATFAPSEVGEYRRALDGQVLRCPWHGWEFDITNGCSLFDPETKLVTYPVRVQGDDVIVEV